MTKPRTHRLFTFIPAHSRDRGSLEKLGLPAMICIVVLFCAAAVTAAPAQSTFFTSLVSFDWSNGASPYDALVQGADGNFYGTTAWGGSFCPPNGCGTVFKLTPAGALTTLHSFDYIDGAIPYAAPVQASDGNFYGTTGSGGAYGAGTVFEMTPAGLLTTLYSFDSTDGGTPQAGLVQAADGIFYGTTSGGGMYRTGTVFRIGVVRTCATCRR